MPVYASLFLFCCLSWTTKDQPILYYMTAQLLLVAGYLWLLQHKLDWRAGTAVLIAFCLATPAVHETDHYRYIWDGMIQLKGMNPFAQAPAQLAGDYPWAALINHSHLHTIYPPVAQILFTLAVCINPFYWLGGFEHFQADNPWDIWRLELGWRLMIALGLSLLCYLLRRKRWDLLLMHPLVVVHGLANVHLDFLFLASLAVMFNRGVNFAGFTAASLLRFLPLLWLPLLLRHRSQLILALVTMAGFWCAYAWGANGELFTSLATYGRHWSFWPFVHDALRLSLAPWVTDSVFYAKALSVGLGLGVLAWVWRRRFSLRLGSLILTTVALALSPTLHPWYLMSLVFLGLPYRGILWSPFVWPCLALFSHAFYWQGQDVLWLRLVMYSVVSYLLIRDGRVLQRS